MKARCDPAVSASAATPLHTVACKQCQATFAPFVHVADASDSCMRVAQFACTPVDIMDMNREENIRAPLVASMPRLPRGC